MKRFKNKRVCQISISFTDHIFKILNSSVIQSARIYCVIPYILWQLLIPIIPLGKWADTISTISRQILEKQKTKYLMGFNIVSLLVLFSIIPFTQVQSEYYPQNPEMTLKMPEITINTEETFQMPVPGYISQYYGWLHHGIDIAGNNGVAVYPITNGIVKEIAYAPFGYGLQVIIEHGNGIISRYAHLQMENVELNQKVTKHDILGYVGSTGWSTGPHLHLEVYQSNRSVNPFAYVPAKYSEEIKVIAANNSNIASQKVGMSSKTASISAQVEYKEVAEDFTDPNWFNSATPSASDKK